MARERERGPTREGARRAGSGGGGGGGGRDFSQREALLHVNEMLGGMDPHGLCGTCKVRPIEQSILL